MGLFGMDGLIKKHIMKVQAWQILFDWLFLFQWNNHGFYSPASPMTLVTSVTKLLDNLDNALVNTSSASSYLKRATTNLSYKYNEHWTWTLEPWDTGSKKLIVIVIIIVLVLVIIIIIIIIRHNHFISNVNFQPPICTQKNNIPMWVVQGILRRPGFGSCKTPEHLHFVLK